MTMDESVKILITAALSIFASNGFWSFLLSVLNVETAERKLIKGLAHDRIIHLCDKYIQRGNWITADEYDNLYMYLWMPYEKCRGNGTAKKAIEDMQRKLTIVQNPPSDYKPCV